MEVGRDLAALGDVEEGEADEEGFHLGVQQRDGLKLKEVSEV